MRILSAVMGLAFVMPASALEVRCVDNVAELDAAYRLGESDDVEIRLVTGTYNVAFTCQDNQPLVACSEIDNAVTIRGGYTTGTCSGRVADPAATVVTNPGRKIELDMYDLAMERLTVRDATYFDTYSESLFSANFRIELSRI
jgi:hypothetical protein